QLARVFAAPSRLPLWVAATLRSAPSRPLLARPVAPALPLSAPPLPAGAVLLLLPGSANRDARVFDDPDDYRL
ncbi:cytochrome P450, partial [Mycobacterium tuberculosis]